MVADVANEVDPDTGNLAYREVIATIMRQSGKTVYVFSSKVDRAIGWPDQRVVYTAQTGADARKKILEDEFPVLERSPLKGMLTHMHRAAGSESVLFSNGSRIGVAATSQDSGHGFTVDLGILDEFWNDQDDRREQAMLPAMSTRPNAQLLLTSTMGTDASTFLNRKVEAGRAASIKNIGSGIAYFEWSIPPDADIESPDVWWEYMPALGWTISEGAVAHAFQTMEEAEFRRAYGNQATKGVHDQLIPSSQWEAVCDKTAEVERDALVAFVIDVLPDRSSAAIAVSDGKTVELVEHRPGTGWIKDRALELVNSWRGYLLIDGGGPAVSVANEIETAGFSVDKLSGGEVIAACAGMYDAIADRKVKVRTDRAIDEAVRGLAKRPVGDRWVWSRTTSIADITPFMAATIAYDWASRNLGGGPSVFTFTPEDLA